MADYKVPGQYDYEGIILKMPNFPPTSLEKTRVFPFEEGDIVIASYPKSGQTWMTQILSSFLAKGGKEIVGMNEDLQRRVKYMELHTTPQAPAIVDILAKTPAPRVMKTHLPAKIFKNGLEEGKGKFVVTMRNPKDCLVSYYHFYRAMTSFGNFPGSWEDFFKLFKAKGLMYGDWLDFNISWWSEQHRDNVHVVKYEDMKKKPQVAISKLASFCDADLSDDVIEIIAKESTFESMQANPLTNLSSMPKSVYDHTISPFLRKGIVGDWQNFFTDEQNDYMEEHYIAKAGDHGLTFDYTM